MHLIAKRLLTTIFSAGIFVLVASSASSQPADVPVTPQGVTTLTERGSPSKVAASPDCRPGADFDSGSGRRGER
jgi:hypothetical protein